jgi:hypothetical protein
MGAGTGTQNERGTGAYIISGQNNSLKRQLSGSPQTVQNGPELSQKTFFGGTGIRGPTQKWGSGVPHKFFGSACGGRGSPHPVFVKCGLPHPKCGLPHQEWGSL